MRNLIGIYKPWLTWFMPRRNFAMWSFSALLIVGAGLFPLEAVLGLPYHLCFLTVAALTMALTVLLIVGWQWQLLSFVTLAALALAAYGWPKIGKEYMPKLDEGSILDMPITVPRVSVTQAAADLEDARRDYPPLSGSGIDRRQGGPCRHAHGPFAAGHDRKRDYAPAQGAMAAAEARFQRRLAADGRGNDGLAESESAR